MANTDGAPWQPPDGVTAALPPVNGNPTPAMSRWRAQKSGGRRIVAALALLIAVGIVVAIVLGGGSSPPSRAANAPISSSTTAIVQRRDLVQIDSESGTLGHLNPQMVYSRLSGTITWLPSVGEMIRPGQTLFQVGGEPVILMNGRTPAYRDLGSSDGDANDILELNRNLVALGFNPEGIIVDDAWQAATTAGVDDLQASLGETRTGTLTLGRIVFLPGERLVSSISAQLGSQAAVRAVVPAPAFVSLTTTATKSESTTTSSGTRTAQPRHVKTPNTLATLLSLLRAETAQLNAAAAQLRAATQNGGSAPKRGTNPPPTSTTKTTNDAPANSGGDTAGGGSATPVLATSSPRLVVTVQLDPTKQTEAKVGEHVTVELPSGNMVKGRISAVSSVGQLSNGTSNDGGGGTAAATGSGSPTTVPVTITLRGRPSGKGLDQASVSVNFAEAKVRHALSVPVTALLATQGGRYALQDAAAPHRLIPVTPGLFAAGYVQISGPGIYPGLVVSDSQG